MRNLNIHACWLDKECRSDGVPAFTYLNLYWFTIRINPVYQRHVYFKESHWTWKPRHLVQFWRQYNRPDRPGGTDPRWSTREGLTALHREHDELMERLVAGTITPAEVAQQLYLAKPEVKRHLRYYLQRTRTDSDIKALGYGRFYLRNRHAPVSSPPSKR